MIEPIYLVAIGLGVVSFLAGIIAFAQGRIINRIETRVTHLEADSDALGKLVVELDKDYQARKSRCRTMHD